MEPIINTDGPSAPQYGHSCSSLRNISLTDTSSFADCIMVFFLLIKPAVPTAPPTPATTPSPSMAPPPTIAAVPPAIPNPPIATAPPPRYAKQALVRAAPLSPAKFEPTKATAIVGANTSAAAITTIAIPAVTVTDVNTVFRTSFNSRSTLS